MVLLATAPLAHLPQATLGATLVFVATKLFRARQLRTVLRFDRVEFALTATTLVVVALVGIEQGVALAIALSLADRTRRTARPRDAIVGREPGTDHWIPVDIGKTTEEVPGSLSTSCTPRSGTAMPTSSVPGSASPSVQPLPP